MHPRLHFVVVATSTVQFGCCVPLLCDVNMPAGHSSPVYKCVIEARGQRPSSCDQSHGIQNHQFCAPAACLFALAVVVAVGIRYM
jgi:hypothetical protein